MPFDESTPPSGAADQPLPPVTEEMRNPPRTVITEADLGVEPGEAQEPAGAEAVAPEQQTAGALGEVATQIPVTDASENTTSESEDTRWGIAKAETIGAGTREIGDRRTFDPFENRSENPNEKDDDIEVIIKSLEKIYDLNPELFQKMPTQEFTSIALEAGRLIEQIRNAEQRYGNVIEEENFFKSCLYDKKLPQRFELENSIKAMIFNLGLNVEQSEELRRQFQNATFNSFDKSPKEIVENFIGIAKVQVIIAGKILERIRDKSKAFQDQYKPQVTSESGEAAPKFGGYPGEVYESPEQLAKRQEQVKEQSVH